MRARRFLLFVVVAASSMFVASRAEAAPFVCGSSVTHDFLLAADTYCPGSPGIVVGASNITIDLGGHTLRGDKTAPNYGIDGSGGFDHVTLKNGTVEQFYVGVVFNNANNGVHVVHVISAGNVGAGIGVEGSGAVVSASRAIGNGVDGIGLEGASPRVISSRGDGNGHDGLVIASSATPLVQSSVFTGNGNDGIDILSSSTRVLSSEGSGNGVNGINLNFSPSSVVSGSKASANGLDGIAIDHSAGARVTNSYAAGNVQDGIHIGGDHARVASSSVSGNGYHGIEIAGDAPKIGRLPGQPVSARNHADGNGYAGASSDGQGWGIYASGFSTSPVGRNEASGNDDPTECNPADLC